MCLDLGGECGTTCYNSLLGVSSHPFRFLDARQGYYIYIYYNKWSKKWCLNQCHALSGPLQDLVYKILSVSSDGLAGGPGLPRIFVVIKYDKLIAWLELFHDFRSAPQGSLPQIVFHYVSFGFPTSKNNIVGGSRSMF